MGQGLRLASLLRALPVALLFAACSCQIAGAEQIATLQAAFSPDRLGRYATVFLGFRISSLPAGAQLPLRSMSVFLPGELGTATSGLGLETCRRSTLEERGPIGCPSDSLMGRGTATAELPIEGDPLVQRAPVDVFSAPVQNGRLALMVFVDAKSPVTAELVFPATVVPAASPYSEGIDTDVPLVPVLPEGPDATVTLFQIALGATPAGPDHFVYYRSVRGHRLAYSPRGLLVPPVCPRGGWPFAAHFTFEGGSATTARTTAPCPDAKHRIRR